jgi:hypothetical protein
MRLLKKARQRIQEFLLAVKRPDRALIANVLPSKKPTLAQVQHIDLFLDTWEKNVIGAMGFVALISLLGFFWSLKILNTVQGPAEGGVFQEVLVGSPRHINPIFAVTDTDRTLFFLCATHISATSHHLPNRANLVAKKQSPLH